MFLWVYLISYSQTLSAFTTYFPRLQRRWIGFRCLPLLPSSFLSSSSIPLPPPHIVSLPLSLIPRTCFALPSFQWLFIPMVQEKPCQTITRLPKPPLKILSDSLYESLVRCAWMCRSRNVWEYGSWWYFRWGNFHWDDDLIFDLHLVHQITCNLWINQYEPFESTCTAADH